MPPPPPSVAPVLQLVQPKVDSSAIVACLELVLAKARAGEILGVAVIYQYLDGDVGYQYAVEPGARPTLMVGQLSVCGVSMIDRYNLTGSEKASR